MLSAKYISKVCAVIQLQFVIVLQVTKIQLQFFVLFRILS